MDVLRGDAMELQEKLDLWVKITGVNPEEERTSYTISFNDDLSDYDISEMNAKIQKSLDYDATGRFAEAYLSLSFKQYLKKRKIDAYQLMIDPSVKQYISDLEKLHHAIQEENVDVEIMNDMKKAMDHYQLESNRLDLFDVVELHTSAQNNINKLEVVQFSAGPMSNEDFKVIKDIYMYNDISGIIESAVKGFINGVSLCYIRDKEELQESYFAFVIKNGENLYIMTDRPKHKHPNQKYMRRCPGREMGNRINSAWFPYSITNIDMSDMYNNGRYGVQEKMTELSTKANNEKEENTGIKIGSLSTITQDEAFWAIMMFSFIKERFYDNEYKCPQLSYVGGMVSHPALDTEKYDIAVYNKLNSITLDTITDPRKSNLEYSWKSVHLYDYIVDRYFDKIPQHYYNVVGPTDTVLLEDMQRPFSDQRKYLALAVNDYGTKENFEYRQQWIARYNLAVAISEKEKEDFDANEKRISEYLLSELNKKKEDIIKKAMKGELLSKKLVHANTFGTEFTDENVSFSKITSLDKWYDEKGTWGRISVGQKSLYCCKNEYICNITGAKAGVVIKVDPKRVEDLAYLLDVTVDELPVELHHWHTADHYVGNSILDNIDPFDWVLKDSYNKKTFSYNFFLSKAAYVKLRREFGLSDNKFWLTLKPKCFNEDSYLAKENLCSGEKTDWRSSLYKKKCQKCKYWKSGIAQS